MVLRRYLALYHGVESTFGSSTQKLEPLPSSLSTTDGTSHISDQTFDNHQPDTTAFGI